MPAPAVIAPREEFSYLQIAAPHAFGSLAAKLAAKKSMAENVPTEIEEYLDHCFDKYFKGLIEQFHMSEPKKEVAGIGALYEASAQNLKIRLLNDRGLTAFEAASVHQPDDFRDVELIAELFRGTSEQRRGIIRLGLEEQARLLQTRWNELNAMFAADQVVKTHSKLLQLGVQRSKLLFG